MRPDLGIGEENGRSTPFAVNEWANEAASPWLNAVRAARSFLPTDGAAQLGEGTCELALMLKSEANAKALAPCVQATAGLPGRQPEGTGQANQRRLRSWLGALCIAMLHR